MNRRNAAVVVVATSLLIMLSVPAAFAQSQARVYQDHTPIWRVDVPVMATTVPAGTVLDIVGRTGTGTFFKVVIPEQFGGHGEVGLIAASSIVLVPRSGEAPVRGGSSPVNPPPTRPNDQRAPAERTSDRRGDVGLSLRGFGQAGITMPSAQESFQTIADQAYGFTFGGGVQLRIRNGIFLEGSLDQFKKTGERVFVYGDTVFPLGIPNTITVRPLLFTAGYTFGSTRRIAPYVGGGIGLFHFTERTPFSEDAEGVDEKHTGYRVSGGVEFRTSQWLSTAIEATFTRVPDSLGVSGVSQVFGERDLGGFEFRAKLLFGR